MQFKTLYLRKGREKALRRRHPWIFSGALQNIPTELKEGDWVKVYNQNDSLEALGFFHPGMIAVKVLDFADWDRVEALISKRLEESIALRRKLGYFQNEHTNCFRLVFGEGDLMPGLIIDCYNQSAVVQIHDRAWQEWLEYLSDYLVRELGFSHVISKPAGKLSDLKARLLYGASADEVVLENGLQFKVDLLQGQKTGFFLDQRENRAKLESYCKDKRVLNLYGYTGGFSLYALRGGAREVSTVDLSKPALKLADENTGLNFPSRHHTTVEADIMDFLKESTARYDVLIVDPPAFSKSKKSLHRAVQAYKRLNIKAFKAADRGAILFTFSCSQHMTAALFSDTIRAAAIESGRPMRILDTLRQPSDHPVNIYHPEGEYLKGLILQLD